MDRYTETSYTSYGQHIGSSFKGILFGLLLLIGSIVLIWWNEGRSVDQADALEEMQQKITTLASPRYDASLEGKAVLVQGEVTPRQVVMDTQFEVSTDGLVLRRKVEMYQWKETSHSESKDKLGGGTETVTTYEYHKVWSSMPIDTSFFKQKSGHENPPMHYESMTFSTDAQLGDFYLDKRMIGHIGANTPLDLSKLPKENGAVKNYRSFLYIGEDPAVPKVGDVKITYTYAPAGLYTVAAKASGKALVPYMTQNGKALVFIRSGRVEAQTIFKEELESNAMLTWVLRIVGLSLMFVGFSLIMGPLQAFARVIPALGSLVGGATGIVAAVLTLIFGSLIIALAWLGARPMLSLVIIGAGVGIAFVLGKFGKKKQVVSSAPPSEPTSATPPPREAPKLKGDDDQEEKPAATPPPRR